MTTAPLLSRRDALGLLAAAGCAVAIPAAAQNYPTKVVTIVVPFGGGNAYDVMVRALAEQLRQATDQAFIVEPRQGALGSIASSFVARAAPDGYTLLFGANSTHAANVHLFKKLSYDPVADFAPITTIARIPQVLIASPNLPARDLKELIELAKSQPGRFNFGSSSATGRVASEQFRKSAGIDAVHVPYKTTAQALTDLMSGQLQFMIADAGAGIAQAQGGKVRAFAVTSAQRLAAAPDIPTMSEAGLPGYEFTAWLALFAPAKTPPDIVKRLSDLVNAALRVPAMRDQLARLYAEPYPGDPDSLRQLVAQDTVRWGQMIKAAGIEPE
ncbi:MAG TPA: tripartite tricarboxylate transporter substrate binding protein [Ramlibacter sp.]|nr:tripartite tricarboxylate transporter substrate binding protein [Ramlibacter sp.]